MSKLAHYQKYQLIYESFFILCFFMINGTIIATSVIMEASRGDNVPSFLLWEPFVWEYASALCLIALVPALAWLLNTYPIDGKNLKLTALIYLLGSFIFSGLHVSGMVAIREITYWTQGMNYNIGDIVFELTYEYRKDLWSFIFLSAAILSYRFILSRLQGEASLIGNGEDESQSQSCDRLLIKKLGKEFIIKVIDIEWLESSGNYVNLHIKGRIYPLRSTLSHLIDQISDKGFSRIHRSHGVNLDAIDSITPLSSGDSEVKLNDGKVLNISRRYKDALKVRLQA